MVDELKNFSFRFGVLEAEVRTVRGWRGLIKWIERETAQWDWLVEGDPETDSRGLAASVQNGWSSLYNTVTAQFRQDQPVDDATATLAVLQSQLFGSESQRGQLIIDIRMSAGAECAAFAYSFLRGAVTVGAATNKNEFLGALLTTIPDIRHASDFSERLQRERSNYRNAIRSALARIDEQNAERDGSIKDQTARGKALILKVFQRRRDSWRSVQDAWSEKALNAVSDIKAVENTYLEKMRLQAPVQYWQSKSLQHQGRENSAVTRLKWFFPLTFGALAFAFYFAARLILDHRPPDGQVTPVALYVVVTAGLAVISTMAFWVGRLFTKLFLSEHHLKNDADERAVMTETYLALTNEGAAAEADRQIILNALFRSTPDGIVKDDGPSDLSVQAMLSKIVMR